MCEIYVATIYLTMTFLSVIMGFSGVINGAIMGKYFTGTEHFCPNMINQ